MATVQEVLQDQDFLNLPLEEKRKVLVAIDDNFVALPSIEQDKVLTSIGLPTKESEGFLGANVIEPAMTAVTGAISEPIAGIAGLAKTITSGPEAGAETIRQTREGLTYQPKTEAGQEGLRKLGETFAPAAEILQGAEQYLGDEVYEATGSPALAAAATTLPTVILEAIGLAAPKIAIKGAKRIKQLANNRAIKRAIVEAAPEIDQIKDVSRAIYRELDESGVRIQPKAYSSMVNKINQDIARAGFDPDLTPKTAAVLKRLNTEKGMGKSLTEVDTLRKVAQNAASAVEPSDARLGSMIIEHIDDFLDEAGPVKFQKGAIKASEVAPKYRAARELWGRARRSELINEAFDKAKRAASGYENGIVQEFRRILNNKKLKKFFKPDEVKAMNDVVMGTTPTNIAKLIGRLGFSEGHATNIIGGSLGIAAGASVGGAPGAVVVPIIGQVSRKLAQRLTAKNANFADAIVRAGSDAKEIAKQYMLRTPKAVRKAEELSELLVNPNVNIDNLLISENSFMKSAAEIAKGYRVIEAATAGAPGAIESIQEEEQ